MKAAIGPAVELARARTALQLRAHRHLQDKLLARGVEGDDLEVEEADEGGTAEHRLDVVVRQRFGIGRHAGDSTSGTFAGTPIA